MRIILSKLCQFNVNELDTIIYAAKREKNKKLSYSILDSFMEEYEWSKNNMQQWSKCIFIDKSDYDDEFYMINISLEVENENNSWEVEIEMTSEEGCLLYGSRISHNGSAQCEDCDIDGWIDYAKNQYNSDSIVAILKRCIALADSNGC